MRTINNLDPLSSIITEWEIVFSVNALRYEVPGASKWVYAQGGHSIGHSPPQGEGSPTTFLDPSETFSLLHG